MEQSEKLTFTQIVKNLSAFYGNQRIMIVFTIACHWSLSWGSYIQSKASLPISRRSILILSSQLLAGIPSRLLPSGFPTKILYAFLISPMRATYHTHFSLLDLIILVRCGEVYKLWSSPLCSLLQLTFTSSLLGADILLSILWSNTLSLCSSLPH